MRRKLAVVARGQIEGLQVIGYHGEVDASHTPGRREPIFTAQERLAGIEHTEQPAKRVRFVWVDIGAPATAENLRGNATWFARVLPAYLGRIVVVVGLNERNYAEALLTEAPRARTRSVDSFVQWLSKIQTPAPEDVLVQRIGDAVAWYCSYSEAYVLYKRIGRVAKKQMLKAASSGDNKALYEMSWWFSRVALTESDDYLAAVGLEQCDSEIAEIYLKAVTPRSIGREKVVAGLDRARRRFHTLCIQDS